VSAQPRESARPVTPPTPTFEDVAARVRDDFYAPISGERRKLAIALILSSLIGAAHLARVGTLGARVTAAIVVLFALVTPAVLEIVARRRARDPRAVIRSAAFALGRVETQRALDHVALAERIAVSPDHEGVSPSLARLHASRALGKLDLSRLGPTGERFGRLGRTTALVLIVVTLIVLAVAPARFVEGVDVALARKGLAPIPLPWLEEVELTLHPPMYVHKHDARYQGYGGFTAERGSELLVRGLPRRSGRTLVLADDHHEIPFLDDGAGGVVAHWSVTVSGHLRVRARFGAVAIDEPRGWDLIAIQDQTPKVELEGAPGTIEIAKTDGAIPLRYDASDDHGLREVHLVIRTGTREERRVLAKLDGEPKHDRGGYVLRTTDPLLQKARTPVRLRIEARDNDPITGPKWGRSAELTLIPPVIGAAEAKRYEDAVATRDQLVDLLAKAIAAEGKVDAATASELSKAFDTTSESLEAFLSSSHDGLRVPSRLGMLLRGRLRKVREAVAAEVKSPTNATHATMVATLEKVVLAFDGAVRSLGTRDSKVVAKLLSEVADDGAETLRELGSKPTDVEAANRVDIDVKALDGGGVSLRRLGELGRDLGEIVENDLRRVARARDAKDLLHAELAMKDLAMRLRLPVASFGGGGNPSAPGEPTDDDGGESGEESEGEENAAKQQQQLEDLTKEHGDAVGSVEDLLRQAEDPKQLEGLEEEAKRRAKRLRDSVSTLPKSGGLKKTLEASEAATREKVEAMAEFLEKLQLGDAHERGDSSLKAIEEARDRAWAAPGADERLDGVAIEVQKQLDWIDDLLKKLRKAAAAKAADKVKGVAPREKDLQKKAEDLGEKSEKEAPLPGPVKDLLEKAAKKMQEAAGKLESGEGDKALELQKDAQRLLEKARDAARNEEQQPSGGGENGSKSFDEKVDIPPADEHKGPEAFRKRVLEGLKGGATNPKLQEAIKRYAEGLVR
jgi:hypothetical protein